MRRITRWHLLAFAAGMMFGSCSTAHATLAGPDPLDSPSRFALESGGESLAHDVEASGAFDTAAMSNTVVAEQVTVREPSSLSLLGFGVLGMAGWTLRQRRK